MISMVRICIWSMKGLCVCVRVYLWRSWMSVYCCRMFWTSNVFLSKHKRWDKWAKVYVRFFSSTHIRRPKMSSKFAIQATEIDCASQCAPAHFSCACVCMGVREWECFVERWMWTLERVCSVCVNCFDGHFWCLRASEMAFLEADERKTITKVNFIKCFRKQKLKEETNTWLLVFVVFDVLREICGNDKNQINIFV